MVNKRHPLVSSKNLKKRNFLGHSKDNTFEVFELPQIAERWHFVEPSAMPRGINPLVPSENFGLNSLGHSKDDTFEVFEPFRNIEGWHLSTCTCISWRSL